MIERILYRALIDGLDQFEANPKLFDDLFGENYGLSVEEVQAIKTVFVAEKPNVIHSYARSDSVFPLYAIVLQGEDETEHYIGDYAGEIEDEDDPRYRAEIVSSIWGHTHQVLVYTEHPDVTLYYYEIAKAILLSSPLLPNTEGLFELHFSGADMIPDSRYIPAHLFVRQLTIKAQREFQRIDLSTREGRAYQVGGIHVDSGEDPAEIGGVKTLVTPYAAGEDNGT